MITVRPKWIGRFEIARTGRATAELEAGFDDCDLDEVEKIIVEELRARRTLAKTNGRSDDGLSVNAWLRATCYQIILAFLTIDEGEELFSRLQRNKRFVRGSQRDRDVFQGGIVAIFAKSSKAVTVRDRERLAAPMWHGFRHYIPPALLLGFNAQYPAHVAKLAGWRNHIEPDLEGWVVEQRIYSNFRDCSLDAYRGAYPQSLQRKVNTAMERAHRSLRNNDEWPA